MFAVSKGLPANNAVLRGRATGVSSFKAGNPDQQRSNFQRSTADMSASRPPYSQANGRRSQSGARGDAPDPASQHHEQVVSYLHTWWKRTCNELELSQQATGACDGNLVVRLLAPCVLYDLLCNTDIYHDQRTSKHLAELGRRNQALEQDR